MSSFERIALALEAIVQKQAEFDPLIFIVPFASAFAAVSLSAWFVHIQARVQRKTERTQSLVDQYFSREFISHRASLYKTQEKVRNQQTTMRKIASGYVYPIEEEWYEGDEVDGLTEHEHITLYTGYLERVAHGISNKLVDTEFLKGAIKYELNWHSDILRSLVKTAREIADEKRQPAPSLCSNIEKVLNICGLPKNEIIISKDPQNGT